MIGNIRLSQRCDEVVGSRGLNLINQKLVLRALRPIRTISSWFGTSMRIIFCICSLHESQRGVGFHGNRTQVYGTEYQTHVILARMQEKISGRKKMGIEEDNNDAYQNQTNPTKTILNSTARKWPKIS